MIENKMKVGNNMEQTNEAEIRINYCKTLEDSKKLESLGDKILKLAASEDDAIGNIASKWKGNAGKEYVMKGRRNILLLKKKGQKLILEAQILRENAERTYRTEQTILNIMNHIN